ncbi:CU044_2847 family protein [Catellatospora citrea]|uniref:Trypsin-co-occurring domain-containing protein n=1 Tax=Catellatospora citrea TaxID=53366 RepID=A0A8J3P1J5_9ACTN|nr:CU044_2847 family protein [Catellatospora citrea]RKE05464.1 hypothetical protein C8E86_0261 [Catellatospora citrea]GIG00138.1 hypothetical protein Cci01nite_52310 [Catellatospora citrea]
MMQDQPVQAGISSDGERLMDDRGVERVVTAYLSSGEPVRVVLSEAGSSDGLTSVGLRDLELERALAAIGEIGSAVIEKLKAARPSRATVELRLGFSVESGKLTTLWLGGRGDASMAVTLEWLRHNDDGGDDANSLPDEEAEAGQHG